ncbi:hypothetical protein MTO96_029805 [Rhipicephalus appendiculatus]
MRDQEAMFWNIIARLPPELLTLIFWHMDIETLSNMCDAAPKLKSLAFCPTIMKIVRIDPETDFRTVRKFPQETRQELVLGNDVTVVPISVDVRELHFTNCLTLPSTVIMACGQSCINLRELYCVNCLVEPDKIFVLLFEILQGLEKLEWSLHHDDYYQTKLDDQAISEIRSYRKSEGPRLRSMYVEVAVTYATVQLLETFWHRCSILRNLHVHAVLGKRPGTSSDVTDPGVYNPRLTRPTGESIPEDLISCNLAAIEEGTAENVAWLSDVLKQEKSLRGFEQVTVCLEAGSRAPSLFVQAIDSSEYWNYIKRLTFALSAPEGAESPSHPAVAHVGYVNLMRRFLETRLSQITELNLTAFHFGVECNCCNLVASALPKLQALALPPCGINLASSLPSLASGCALLEHLDVRTSPFRCAGSPCNVCRLPLRFSRLSFGILQKNTRLRRLSIDDSAKITNLAFLPECRVEELRLSLDNITDEDFAECPTGTGRATRPEHSALFPDSRGPQGEPVLPRRENPVPDTEPAPPVHPHYGASRAQCSGELLPFSWNQNAAAAFGPRTLRVRMQDFPEQLDTPTQSLRLQREWRGPYATPAWFAFG